MILMLLHDRTQVEIPDGVDVIHRDHTLKCLSATGEILAELQAAEVLAYTCSEISARRLTAEGEAGFELDAAPNSPVESRHHKLPTARHTAGNAVRLNKPAQDETDQTDHQRPQQSRANAVHVECDAVDEVGKPVGKPEQDRVHNDAEEAKRDHRNRE